ncbi:MAG: GMC family oxidoreductase [Blastocatellales bacterium]|nr:GMC family oxidoreductase [Blastocatellales bacterium]
MPYSNHYDVIIIGTGAGGGTLAYELLRRRQHQVLRRGSVPPAQGRLRRNSSFGKLDGVALSAGAPAIAPGFTLDLMAKHSLDFWLTSEDLPDPNNRVTLDRQGNVVLSYTPNNQEPHKRLQSKLQDPMKQQTKCDVHGHDCHQGLFARNLFLGDRIPLAGVAHQNGTIRFGKDPKTSALDPNCKSHKVDNLYVVDGSFFCSSAAVNPALTIMANALRVGDHILERMK